MWLQHATNCQVATCLARLLLRCDLIGYPSQHERGTAGTAHVASVSYTPSTPLFCRYGSAASHIASMPVRDLDMELSNLTRCSSKIWAVTEKSGLNNAAYIQQSAHVSKQYNSLIFKLNARVSSLSPTDSHRVKNHLASILTSYYKLHAPELLLYSCNFSTTSHFSDTGQLVKNFAKTEPPLVKTANFSFREKSFK